MGVHVRFRPDRVYHRLFIHLLHKLRLARLGHGSACASAVSRIPRTIQLSPISCQSLCFCGTVPLLRSIKSSPICCRSLFLCGTVPLPPIFPASFPGHQHNTGFTITSHDTHH